MIQNINPDGFQVRTLVGTDYTNVATINGTGLGLGVSPTTNISVQDGTNMSVLFDRTGTIPEDETLIGDITYRAEAYPSGTFDYAKISAEMRETEGSGGIKLQVAARGTNGALTNGIHISSNELASYSQPLIGIGDTPDTPYGILDVRSHPGDTESWQLATNLGPEYFATDPGLAVVNQADWTRGASVFTREDSGTIGDGADMTVLGESGGSYFCGTGYVWCSTEYSATVNSMNFNFDKDGVAVIAQQGDMSNSDFAAKMCVISEYSSGVMLHIKNNLSQNAKMGYTVKYWEVT